MKRSIGRLQKKTTTDDAPADPDRDYGMGYIFVDETQSVVDGEDGSSDEADREAGESNRDDETKGADSGEEVGAGCENEYDPLTRALMSC